MTRLIEGVPGVVQLALIIILLIVKIFFYYKGCVALERYDNFKSGVYLFWAWLCTPPIVLLMIF